FKDNGAIFAFTFKHAVHAGGDDDERGSGAYEQGIYVDCESLDKALLCRVGDLRGSSVLRTSTLACFIRVNTAAYTPHDGHTEHAGKACVEVKRRREDQSKYFWDLLIVRKQDNQRDNDVDDCHKWHDQGREVCNTLNTTDDDDAQYGRDSDTGVQRWDPPRIFNSGGNTVGLHTRQEVSGCQNHGDCKNAAIDQHERRCFGVSVCLLNVVGRPTTVFPSVFFLHFGNQRQRTLNERGRGARQGHRPHPKDRAWSTKSNCGSNAGNIANADAASQRHHQRLERRDTIV